MGREHNRKWLIFMICGLMGVIYGGCAKKVPSTMQASGLSETGVDSEERIASSNEIFPGERSEIREGKLESTGRMVGLEDIFFEFDRANLGPDARQALDQNIRWIKENPNIRIVIEGHADEHGTNEYNLALGERRARATKQYLITSGVDASRVKIMSLGEERPFCLERHERCWQQNRRAHFVVAN